MKLPKVIIRKSDGEEFILDENTQMYSLRVMKPFEEQGHLISQYSYDTLMNKFSGSFKIKRSFDDIKTYLEVRGFVLVNDCMGWHDDITLYYFKHNKEDRHIIVSHDFDGDDYKVFEDICLDLNSL
jgi:hypothetical protein